MITNDIDEAILLADRIVPLTPGPAATLGPSFAVELARPRNRKELNHDPEFKHLRNAVTTWLVESRKQVRKQAPKAAEPIAIPNLVPVDLTRKRRPSSAPRSIPQPPTHSLVPLRAYWLVEIFRL
jgi:nitrate/nitrite transport system ATP-binding protein